MLPVWLRILKNLPNDSTAYSYCFFCPDSVIVWDGFSHLIVINLMSFHVRDTCAALITTCFSKTPGEDHHCLLMSSPLRMQSPGGFVLTDFISQSCVVIWWVTSATFIEVMKTMILMLWQNQVEFCSGDSEWHAFGNLVLYNNKFVFLYIPEYFLHNFLRMIHH